MSGHLSLDTTREPPYHPTSVMTSPRCLSRLGLLGALVLILLAAAAAGCARSPVEQAIAGKFDAERNNKIVTSYCSSCHSHKDFKPDPHLALVSTLYEKKPYQGATECRTCHQLKLRGLAIPWIERTTRRPHGRLTPLAKRTTPPSPTKAK
ncbi:MAG: hypothetical protein V3R38_02385 [bacterium]